MDRISARRRRLAPITASALAALIVAMVAIHLAGVPRPRAPRGSAGSAPSSFPASPHRLISNNLKTGDTLHLDLSTLPQTAVWMLASSNTGPSYVGPYLTALGSDWFVLQGPILMGGGSQLQLGVPVPTGPGLVGLEFAIQCAVVSPLAADVGFSNGITLRVSQGVGKNILVLRQTGAACGLANAAAQVDSLVVGLQLLGNQVCVVDDVLPLSLLDFDCIFDLRFTTPPAARETARYVEFLRMCGGVFFVAGPYAGCAPGQQRAAWIGSLLNTTLGVGVTISSGGTLSNGFTEQIDPSAGPEFLSAAMGIAGLSMDVSDEGGNFGPPGAAAAGVPWLTGQTVLGPKVYGMFFDPSTMPTETVGGRVAVLFSGGPNTFLPTSSSPYPELIMGNMAAYLDR